MNRLEVIGAGPGAGDMLTLRARAAIDGAQAVWCAERTEELVPEEKRRRLSPFSRAMESASHKRIIIRSIAEYDQLRASEGVFFFSQFRRFENDLSHQADSVHVDPGFR